MLDEAEDDVLACLNFPAAHRTRLNSTNPLERLNKEVKRRTDGVGIFPNEASIRRLVGAVLMEQNDDWIQGKRYMTLETMAEVRAVSELTPAALPNQPRTTSPEMPPGNLHQLDGLYPVTTGSVAKARN